MKIKSKPVNKDLVLGAFAQSIEKYYNGWSNLMARSFVSGLFTALGATVGLALVVTLGGVILDQLGVLPGVGQFFVKISDLLDKSLPTLKK